MTSPILVVRHISNAVTPKLPRSGDVGYDLTCVKIDKQVGNTTWYDTGISIKPPPGYYVQIVPRSSLSKTGYILHNSIGIIDPNYRGSLKVALTKIDPSAEELKLPFTRVQMIVQKVHTPRICEISELDMTERGDGGFGSTD